MPAEDCSALAVRFEWPTLDGVTFREARPDDLPACVAMLHEAYEGWPGRELDVPPIDHLRWELEMPDAGTRATIREVDGEIAGFAVFLPRCFRIGERSALVSEGADAAVAPRFQGRGVYRQGIRWSNTFVHGPAFSLNYSRNPIVVGFRRRRTLAEAQGTGYLRIGSPPTVLVRPFDVRGIARREGTGALQRLAITAGIPALSAWSRVRHRPGGGRRTGLRATEVVRFDDRVDRLLEAALRPFDVVQRRDARFLNWRYLDRRGGRATVTAVEDHEQLLGYAAMTVSHGRGHLMDLVTLPGRDDVAGLLVDDALVRLRALGADAAVTWSATNHPLYAVLRGAGFFDARRPTGTSIRRHGADDALVDVLTSPTSVIHLMPGDSTVL